MTKKIQLPNEDPIELSEKEAKAIFDSLGLLKQLVLNVGIQAAKVSLSKAEVASATTAKEIEELRMKFLPVRNTEEA